MNEVRQRSRIGSTTTSAVALLAVSDQSMPMGLSSGLRGVVGAYNLFSIVSVAAKKSNREQTSTMTMMTGDAAVNTEKNIKERFTSASRSVATVASSSNESSASRSVAIGASNANTIPGSTASTSQTSSRPESLVGLFSTTALHSVVSRDGSSTRSVTQSSNGRTTFEGTIP